MQNMWESELNERKVLVPQSPLRGSDITAYGKCSFCHLNGDFRTHFLDIGGGIKLEIRVCPFCADITEFDGEDLNSSIDDNVVSGEEIVDQILNIISTMPLNMTIQELRITLDQLCDLAEKATVIEPHQVPVRPSF